MTDTNFENRSIVCNVTSCKNHNNSKNYCALKAIRVGTHESDPTEIPCTDCQSFEQKNETC